MKPELIVIHHSRTRDSGTVSWGAIRKWHTGKIGGDDNYYTKHPMSQIAYHAGIELIGEHYEILTGRMMNEQGAHTRGHNKYSVGIVFIGNFDKDEVNPEQWNLGVKFVASLCDVLNIDPIYIFAHSKFSNYKTCPGKNFSILGFQAQIKALLNK